MIRFLFIIFFSTALFGQYNLVYNPSFEQCLNCPNNTNFGGQIGLHLNPNILIPGWSNPNYLTPDYFHLENSNLQIPDGNAFIGICAFASIFTPELSQYINAREFIMSELIDSLNFNKKYLIEFLIRTSTGGGNFASNNLGVYFSDTALHSTNIYNFPLIPQLNYFNNEIISDTSSWSKFSGIFEALGGEKYMTVGNFKTDLETDFICFLPFWPAEGQSYFFLDKFPVTPIDSIPGGLQVYAGLDHDMCIGDTVFIGEKISNLPANWYLLDGTVVDTNTAGVYVSPAVTTTYVVTLDINGVYSTDTVTVNVGCAGVDVPEKTNFSIGPNPNDGQFAINGQLSEGDIISIVSAEGRVVQTIHINEQTEKQNIDLDLNPGIYLLQISTPQGNYCEKIRLE